MGKSDYETIKKIGEGAFSTVYQVKCLKTNQSYAMKEIEYTRLNDKQKQYAQEEIKIMKKTRNPFIISFHEAFLSDHYLYIVMELAEQGDLQKKIFEMQEKNEKFPIDTVWKFFFQILSGLKALHDQNFIHRDVKPANIFITNEGNLKLADFNVGKEDSRNLVRTRIGTPLIMSPEVLQGKEYSNKTDIWSLGCVVIELATMKRPYEAEHEIALFNKLKKFKVSLPVDKELEKVVKKMMRRNPDKRPSCEDLMKFPGFKRFRKETERKSTVEKRVNDSFRAPSLGNISINKDIRKNMHESPSGRKLRNFSQKTLKAISCERPKILHKYSNEHLNSGYKYPFSPDSPEQRSVNKSKIINNLSLKLIDIEKIDSSKHLKSYDYRNNFPKALKLPLNLTNKLSAHKAKEEFQARFQVPESGSVTALSAPRQKQIMGAYMNDVYIVKARRKKSRGSLNSTNTAATPKSAGKGINLRPMFQNVAK